MTFISALSLTAFRNYEVTAIDDLAHNFVVLIGDNGAGKTNCLEAISLLSPGRGLRNASVADIQSQSANQTQWAVSSHLKDLDGDIMQLGVGRDPQKPSAKIIRANGNPIKNQTELGEICRTIWLTPQMDGLFLQGASERRRFFDRLVATFDPAHTGRMARYEKATRERLNILRDAHDKKISPDTIWLDGLEKIMAETSVAIAAARCDMVIELQIMINSDANPYFPICDIHVNGEVEKALKNGQSALNIEDMAVAQYQSMQGVDGQMGRTHFGIGRTDIAVIYRGKNVNASQCSTGEQKALLTTIILAHARMVERRFGAPPILLFDEICAHFDDHRKQALFDILSQMNGQIWMTGQDPHAFSSLKNKRLITITDNNFT
jgi:DNA replication and repair protein RecF